MLINILLIDLSIKEVVIAALYQYISLFIKKLFHIHILKVMLWSCLSGLQNDHKEIMAEIEEALHKLHAREKAKRQQDEAEAQDESMEQQVTLPPPFARVDAVTQGSPASGAVSDVNYTLVSGCRFR